MSRKIVGLKYPDLTDEILERAPKWDNANESTPLLVEIARRLDLLNIRELLLWHRTNETRKRDPKMWSKTTPPVLRDWYKAVKAEMERQAREEGKKFTSENCELPGNLKNFRWNLSDLAAK